MARSSSSVSFAFGCEMKRLLPILIAVSLLQACSDPVAKLRSQAIQDYPVWWTKPEQLALIRRTHDIPAEYQFKIVGMRGAATSRDRDYGLYEWCFRFLKSPDDFIEVRHICYYDSDSVVMHDVKQERIHWKNLKIHKKTFNFRGVDEN